MSRYKIWDKSETIYTPAGGINTPEQWIAKYPWAGLPNAKVVISDGLINGGFCGELSQMQRMYAEQGVVFTEDMTDEEILSAIEDFQLRPPGYDEPTVEERTAAALEAQVLLSLPEEETATTSTPTLMMANAMSTPTLTMANAMSMSTGEEPESPGFCRIKQNYTRGLWNAALVNMAASKGQITQAEASEILNS